MQEYKNILFKNIEVRNVSEHLGREADIQNFKYMLSCMLTEPKLDEILEESHPTWKQELI